VRLPAGFLVEYHAENTYMRARVYGRIGQDERAGAVMLRPCFGYFSGAKDAPCLLAHSKYCSWTVSSVLRFSYVDLPKARESTWKYILISLSHQFLMPFFDKYSKNCQTSNNIARSD
jgi:hypothetical protein